MTKVSKPDLKTRSNAIGECKVTNLKELKSKVLLSVQKMSVKRMKWTICQDSSSASSSDEDALPILPETSSSSSSSLADLSTIEESSLEQGVDSDSSFNSASSHQNPHREESSSSTGLCNFEIENPNRIKVQEVRKVDKDSEKPATNALMKLPTQEDSNERRDDPPDNAPSVAVS